MRAPRDWLHASRRDDRPQAVPQSGDYDRWYRADAPHPQGSVRAATSRCSRSSCALSLERSARRLKAVRRITHVHACGADLHWNHLITYTLVCSSNTRTSGTPVVCEVDPGEGDPLYPWALVRPHDVPERRTRGSRLEHCRAYDARLPRAGTAISSPAPNEAPVIGPSLPHFSPRRD